MKTILILVLLSLSANAIDLQYCMFDSIEQVFQLTTECKIRWCWATPRNYANPDWNTLCKNHLCEGTARNYTDPDWKIDESKNILGLNQCTNDC